MSHRIVYSRELRFQPVGTIIGNTGGRFRKVGPDVWRLLNDADEEVDMPGLVGFAFASEAIHLPAEVLSVPIRKAE